MPRAKKLITNKRTIVNVCNFCGARKIVDEEKYEALYKAGSYESDRSIDCNDCDECTVCLPNKIQRDWMQRVISRITNDYESRIESLERRLDRLNDI